MSDVPTPEQKLEEQRITSEREKTKYGFYKFIIGTVFLSLVTSVGNWVFQYYSLQNEIIAKENEFIGNFLEQALDKDLEIRRDFALYFKTVSPSEDARERWNAYWQLTVETLGTVNAREQELLDLQAKHEAEVKLRDAQLLMAREAQLALAEAQEKALNAAEHDKAKLHEIVLEYGEQVEQARERMVELDAQTDSLNRELSAKTQEIAGLRGNPDYDPRIKLNPIEIDRESIVQQAEEILDILEQRPLERRRPDRAGNPD